MSDLVKRLEALVDDLGQGRACCGVDFIDAAVDAIARIEALEKELEAETGFKHDYKAPRIHWLAD